MCEQTHSLIHVRHTGNKTGLRQCNLQPPAVCGFASIMINCAVGVWSDARNLGPVLRCRTNHKPACLYIIQLKSLNQLFSGLGSCVCVSVCAMHVRRISSVPPDRHHHHHRGGSRAAFHLRSLAQAFERFLCVCVLQRLQSSWLYTCLYV